MVVNIRVSSANGYSGIRNVLFGLGFGLVVQYIEYIETWLRICSNPELCNVISDLDVTFWIKSLEVNREFD